jgi:hypothetical protein
MFAKGELCQMRSLQVFWKFLCISIHELFIDDSYKGDTWEFRFTGFAFICFILSAVGLACLVVWLILNHTMLGLMLLLVVSLYPTVRASQWGCRTINRQWAQAQEFVKTEETEQNTLLRGSQETPDTRNLLRVPKEVAK